MYRKYDLTSEEIAGLANLALATQEALIASMRDMYFVVGSERFHDTLMNMTVSLIL